MFRIFPETSIDFIGARKVAFVVSLLLIALGVFAFAMIWSGSANLGIDFAGGVMLQGHFEKPVAIEDLRTALATEFEDVQVTEVSDFQKKPTRLLSRPSGPKVNPRAKSGWPQSIVSLSIISRRTHSSATPSMLSDRLWGESLRKDAKWAVLISLIGILIYIAIRFDFRSGVAATIATFHDVLAVLGILFIIGREFNLLTVVALLTIAGYSLTDTVVVFDRIRENLKKYRR